MRATTLAQNIEPTVAGVKTGVCRYIESEQPSCPFRQSCLLALIAMFVVTTLPSTHGDCPAVDHHCYCSNGSIYCNNLGVISQVPPFNRSSTTYYRLKISGETTLSTLQAGAFEGVKVTRIILSHLSITTIKPGAFSGLGNILDTLILTSNHLNMITDEAFGGLNQLKNLYLDKNHLTVSAAWFSQLNQLEYMILSDNRLETIPHDAFNGFKKLTLLCLTSNRLTTVNATLFSQLPQLENLYLSADRLETIPDDAFHELYELKNLHMELNRLETVSAAWRQ